MKTVNKKNIQKVAKSLKICLENLKSVEFSDTDALRTNVNKSYSPGTGYKSLICFFEDLLERIPSLKPLFNFFKFKIICENCKSQKNKDFFVNFISISKFKNIKGYINLNEALKDSLSKMNQHGKCKNCNRSHLFKTHQYQYTQFQKYMAIKIEENNSFNLSENLLINYNEIFKFDCIPNVQFKIKGIVTYNNEYKHFIGITNYLESNWLKINCLENKTLKENDILNNLPNNLKDLYFLILEKF